MNIIIIIFNGFHLVNLKILNISIWIESYHQEKNIDSDVNHLIYSDKYSNIRLLYEYSNIQWISGFTNEYSVSQMNIRFHKWIFGTTITN